MINWSSLLWRRTDHTRRVGKLPTSLCPVLPIGADGLAEQDHCSRVGACAHHAVTRPEGAPLTVSLCGERMPGTEDGPGPVFASAASAQRDGGYR